MVTVILHKRSKQHFMKYVLNNKVLTSGSQCKRVHDILYKKLFDNCDDIAILYIYTKCICSVILLYVNLSSLFKSYDSQLCRMKQECLKSVSLYEVSAECNMNIDIYSQSHSSTTFLL